MNKKIEIINKIENLKKELNDLNLKEKNKKYKCSHKKVYIYILEKTIIYTCKKCKKNLVKDELKNSLVNIRSLI